MRGVLFASFGCTHESARTLAIDAVAKRIGADFNDSQVWQAYTSTMIRRALKKRGVVVLGVAEALEEMADAGVTDAIVCSGHLLPGEEYDKLMREASSVSGRFNSLKVSTPLISGTDDLLTIAHIISERFPARDDRAIVLMGHGTRTFANIVYPALDSILSSIGRSDICVATVEAYPEFDDIMPRIESMGVKCVTLFPLMLVAGDHAKNDMAGEEPSSWASILRAKSFEVECDLTGMGEIPAIADLYAAHAHKASKE